MTLRAALAQIDRAMTALRSPAWLILIGHAALQQALIRSNGTLHPIALGLVISAVLAWALALHSASTAVPADLHTAQVGAWVLALWSVLDSFNRPPALHNKTNLDGYHLLLACAAAVLGTYAHDIFGVTSLPRFLVIARRAILFSVALLIGAWVLRTSPNPRIDVFHVHQQAAEAMLAGKSIYEPGVIGTLETFTNKLPIDEYTYLPLGACLTTIAYLFTHDSRWAELVSILVGAFFVWLVARPAQGAHLHARADAERDPRAAPAYAWGDLLSASLLFHGRGSFVLHQAWTEPLALPFLGAFLFLATRGRLVAASVVLGLLCAIKQQMVLYVPFLAMMPGIGFGGVIIAGAAAVATALPFALRTPSGFYRGIIGLHINGPFRPDALALPAAISRSASGYIVPSWVGFVSALVPMLWLKKIPRRPSPLLLGSCVAFGLFYLLGRQAFCNYYYLLDATALFAAATLAE
jgi:hypothetical protein